MARQYREQNVVGTGPLGRILRVAGILLVAGACGGVALCRVTIVQWMDGGDFMPEPPPGGGRGK